MIGIFDSGVGGLTVAREVMKHLPTARILYFGDTARTPYGNKSKKTVVRYALEDTQFLVDRGAAAIIIGCNTASAEATAEIKAAHPNLPIFDCITPAVTAAIAATKNGRIGLIGTRSTVNSGAYQRLIADHDAGLQLFAQACPLLVPLVEENWLKRPETKMILRRYLRPLKEQRVDTLILGCTHYPLLAPLISDTMGLRVTLVDPASEVTAFVAQTLAKQEWNHTTEHQFFVSDLSPATKQIAMRWLGQDVNWQEAIVGDK
ncbi:MAG: glutamate racemase [Patescibacteria group bacterium]|mgnify:CR=1 FL=1